MNLRAVLRAGILLLLTAIPSVYADHPRPKASATLIAKPTCVGQSCSSLFIELIDHAAAPGNGPYRLFPGRHVLRVSYSSIVHEARTTLVIELKPKQHYVLRGENQGFYRFRAWLEDTDAQGEIELGSFPFADRADPS